MIKKASILFLILSLIIIAVFIFPLFKEFINIQDEIKQTQRETEIREKYIKDINEISSDRENYTKEIDKIKKMVPDYPEISATFSYVKKEAEGSNLIVDYLSIFKIIEDETVPFVVINFDFGIKGDYIYFKNFLNKIEEYGRIIKIERVSIKIDEEADYSFGITANIYYYKQ